MTIVPRWEWRIFGESFGPAERRVRLARARVGRWRATSSTCSRAPSDASVKVRDGLMDVKRLLAVDDDGLEQWTPVLKVAVPAVARRTSAFVLETLACAAPPLERDRTRSTRSPASSRTRGLLAVDGPQAARALHDRRLHGRAAPRCGSRRRRRARSRSSPRTRNAWSRRCASSGSRRARQRERRARPQGAGRVRRAALRGHRRRHQLGQVPRRRAARGRRRGGRSSTAPRSPGSAKGSSETRPAGRRADRAHGRRRSRPWPTRRSRDGAEAIAAVGTAGLRIAPNARRVRRRRARRAAGSRSRSSPARRRRGSRTWRRWPGSGCGHAARSSSSTPAAAARSSRSATATRRGAVQRQRRRGALHRALRPRRRGRPRTRWPTRSRRSPPTSRGSTAGRARRGRRDGRRGHEPRRRQARARDVRPGRRAGRACSTRGEIDRQIELYRTRSAEQRREIVGLQPKRAEVILAGACIVRTVLDMLGPRLAHRERPRPAARRAHVDRFGPTTDWRRDMDTQAVSAGTEEHSMRHQSWRSPPNLTGGCGCSPASSGPSPRS